MRAHLMTVLLGMFCLTTGAVSAAGLSVADFGAKGDGKTDDTAAFLQALKKNAHVYIPPGIYKVGDLQLPQDALVEGAGRASVLIPASNDKPIIRLGSGCRVADIRFDGKESKGQAIYGRSVRDVRMTGLYIHDFDAFGIEIANSRDIVIHECHIEDVIRAIELDYCFQAKVTNNTVRRCKQHGIQFWGNWKFERRESSDLTFANNYVEDGGEGAIWGAGAIRVVMTGNTVVRCDDVGLDLEWCDDSTIAGNTVIGAKNAGISCFYSCNNVAITGNSVVVTPREGGLNRGIWLTNTNTEQFPNDTGHRNITITGNSIRAEGAKELPGIHIAAEARNIVFAANVLSNCHVIDARPADARQEQKAE